MKSYLMLNGNNHKISIYVYMETENGKQSMQSQKCWDWSFYLVS